jgi:hypothetical protein
LDILLGKKRKKKFLFSFSGILYEPFLLLDAPIDAHFARADFWAEHLHPDPFVCGILDHGFKVPVDWDRIPESYEEQDNVSARKNYYFVRE